MEKFSMFCMGTLGLTALFITGYLIGDLEGGNALLMWITCNMAMALLLNHNKL